MSRGYLVPSHVVNKAHPLARGLVSFYSVLPNRLGGGGNTFRDWCGQNHGTLTNGPTWSGSAPPGGNGSLSFDNVDDSVSISHSTALDPANITAFVWFKMSYTGGYQSIFGKTNSNSWTSGWGLGASPENSNDIKWWVNSYVGGSQVITAQSNLPSGTWGMLCGTYDGAATKLYLNGALKGTTAYSTALAGSSSPLFVGYIGSLSPMNGYASSAGVFSRALTLSEVAALYQESLAGYPNLLNWVKRPVVSSAAAVVSGNRRRRILCGAAA